MKKLCILLALIMIPASMWALSIESDASFGLFTNEMDAASSVGGGFLELDKTYIFGGLANIDQNNVVSSASATPMVGAFVYGDMPWSAFAKFNHTDQVDTSVDDLKDVVYSYKGTDDIQWKNAERKVNFKNILAETINDRFQFITVYDDMVIGAYVNYQVDNSVDPPAPAAPVNYDPADNYKETVTVNYDKNAATATADPDPAEDFTIESEKKTKNKRTTFSATVPVFISGDEKDMRLSASITMRGDNDSTKFTQIVSDPNDDDSNVVADINAINGTYITDDVPNPGGGSVFTNTINDETKDKENLFRISGSFRQSSKSPLFDGDGKDFTIMGSAGIEFENKIWEDYTNTQDYDYTTFQTAATSERAANEVDDDSEVRDYAAQMTLDVSAGASHAFSYELDNGVSYVLNPQASASFKTGPQDFRLKKKTEINNNDSDADGTVNTKTTSVSTYEGNSSNKTEFGIDLTPTCALQFQPADKKYGLTFGVQGNIGMTAIFESTSPSVVTTETTTLTVATSTESTTTSYSETQGTSNSYIDWDMSAEHRFGMNFDISDNVTLLMELNGNNLLDFDDLTVQALVSLP